ncbi:MAG: NADH-quinone oxidoreductase subunit G [Candidatus Omnitrophica bacterium CG12_big_fil_rev_8_21_14_0_65_45_16]|nr:MAG: NADH-quinone oxidoreductase subunit G [Candidatus Omnitrophica bacterium CG12_big_fil_rev_8_21_14_0_65_45_16]
MPTVTINGQTIEVEKGTTIIQVAEKLGTFIPRYCYHPGLSIAGNCRMCLVEVEKFPKLQIACHVQCSDGMVVHTESERVKKTREHVLEFLLVNHPLDCPVCDQAGECGLQDYYMEHGRYDSRLDEQKVKKSKKAEPIGQTVMLDTERCILCSRCVRFSDEITKTSEFGIFNRGDHSEIGLYPGKELNNPYSGNVVDICPVGALTDRDFRFKCRVWYLKKTNSICTGCSRGCNITMETNTDRPHHGHGERVMRLKPRYQPAINKWWMCDHGRYNYKWIDHGRMTEPVKGSSEHRQTATWQELMRDVSNQIRQSCTDSPESVAVLLSPQQSNESLYLAKKLFVEELKLQHIYLFSPNADGDQDDLLIRSDKHPNRQGAAILGFQEDGENIENLIRRIREHKIKCLYVFGQDLVSRLPHAPITEILKQIPSIIFHGSNSNLTSEMAHFVLPSATYAESFGSFTNFEGKVQFFSQALPALGEARSDLEILIKLANQLGITWPAWDAGDVARDMQAEYQAFKNVIEAANDKEVFSS